MANVLRDVDQPNVEAVVYFVVSPDSGPGHRIYSDEDIHALGGIHTIERILENESYWYVRLGQIRGESSPLGLTFQTSEFARLPHPTEMACKIGRRNPGFRNSEVERHIFKAAFLTIGRMLETWKRKEDGTVEAYTLKELKISPQRLVCLASSLQTLQRIHEIADITVIKYWYDATWPEPQFPDLVLAEFSLTIPLQLRRSVHQEMLVVEVVPLASC